MTFSLTKASIFKLRCLDLIHGTERYGTTDQIRLAFVSTLAFKPESMAKLLKRTSFHHTIGLKFCVATQKRKTGFFF